MSKKIKALKPNVQIPKETTPSTDEYIPFQRKRKESITITERIVREDTFEIYESKWSKEDILAGLKIGNLNIIQSYTEEPFLWVVDTGGSRIAVLQKYGGTGPDYSHVVE